MFLKDPHLKFSMII